MGRDHFSNAPIRILRPSREQRASKVRRRGGRAMEGMAQPPPRAHLPPTRQRGRAVWRARASPSPGLRPPPRRALPPPG